MTLLDQISDALGASGALGDLSSSLGASAADTDSLLSAGLPPFLAALERSPAATEWAPSWAYSATTAATS